MSERLKRRIDSELAQFVRFHQTMEEAVEKYCSDHATPKNPIDWVFAFSVEEGRNGPVVIAHWEEDSHCSCCSNISGSEEIPMEELKPYIEAQWELDEFDRKLKEEETP